MPVTPGAVASFGARVRDGERVVGTFVKLPGLESVDLVARSGFDFCVVDGEHRAAGGERAKIWVPFI